MSLTRRFKAEAQRVGFTMAGACPAVTPKGLHRFYRWLELGYHGEMQYLSNRRAAYAHPDHVLPGARSLLMLGMNYRTEEPSDLSPGSGRVSRYAWGSRDYHDVIHHRLRKLVTWLQREVPGCQARGVVDSAPLLEREFAQLAGLGWIGKHTLLLNRQSGSWFFLAAVLTDIELEYDEPSTQDYCGTCTACLDVCPTKAFPAPHLLDARRCISYLTIELRDAIPDELKSSVDEWVFGCDLCQEVCPWNRRAPTTAEPEFQPRNDLRPMSLEKLFELTDEEFRELFRATPMWRAKRRGILRNAAIVLGNQGDPRAIPALQRGLQDPEPLVQESCAWALSQIIATEK